MTSESGRTGVAKPLPSVEFRYIGEAGGIEATLAAQANIPFSPVATGQIRGRAPSVVARNLIRMVHGAWQCRAIIREFRPDAVFMTGGYVAAPVAWAAWQARPRVPLLIYLPDLTPGQAIQTTSRLAARVAVSFEEVAQYFPGKAVVTGYPVREALLQADRPTARVVLGLESELPVLLVFGGSRGARSINRALIGALPALLPHCEVVHVTGQTDWAEVAEATQGDALPYNLRQRYHAHPYLHQMEQALVAADLAVARAGAATLGEFPAVGLPAILSPYPYAGQHQDVNAAYLADRGAALVLKDADLETGLGPTVLSLLGDRPRLSRMAAAARALARPDAADNIAAELRSLAGY